MKMEGASRKPKAVAMPALSRARYHVVLVVMALGSVALLARTAYLTLWDKDFLRRQGDVRSVHVEPIAAHRGIIRDRNGLPVAVSTPVVSLWVNPKQFLAGGGNVAELARMAAVDGADLAQKLQKNAQRDFLYVKRHMAPEEANAILGKDLEGLYGMTEYQRFYPEGETLSHIIGFTDLDDKGKEGLELSYDDWLRGEPGSRKVVKDLKGNKIKDVAMMRPARPGNDLYLSLDSRAQYMAYRELAQQVSSQGAKAGTLVALDIETGEILAMANVPAYNPNNRVHLDLASMRNRAVTDMFEPGSTMKPFTIAAALESGKYNPHSLFNTNPGSYRVYNKLIRDHENNGVIDLATIITKSSNVGAAQIAMSLPANTLPEMFDRFGFGKNTGSGFPGESAGRLPARSQWHPVEIATMSYGYGVTVSALQLARAYATLANGGLQKSVSFLKATSAEPGKRVLDEKICQQIMPMMESVVTSEGTALKAAVPGYRVAGKTGTAHKAEAGGYSADQYMSLFVGMAPASHPKVVMAVVIDTPSNGQYYGGLVAAPVFSRVMGEMLRLMDIEPDRSAEHLALQGHHPIPEKNREGV